MIDRRPNETMTEEEADALSTKLNLELGQEGDTERFFVAVEAAEGEWVVEERQQKKGLFSRIADAMPEVPW